MAGCDQARGARKGARARLDLSTRDELAARLTRDPETYWLLVKVGGLLDANLRHGWEGGNDFIAAIANRIRLFASPADVLSHLGGNEFALVLEDGGERAAETVRDRALPLLGEPVLIRGELIETRPVITIAFAEPGAEDPWFSALAEHHHRSVQGARDNLRSLYSAASSLDELASTAANAGVEILGLAAVRISLADACSLAGRPTAVAPRAMVVGAPERPLGEVAWWHRPGQLEDIPASSLQLVSDELAIAAERLLASGDAEVDPLTGLLNRRGLERATRGLEIPYAVAFVELDDMKRLNDTCGHKTGDLALCRLAESLHAGRDDDIAARWGGDEFVVVLPGASVAEATGRLERLLRQLRRDTRFGATGFSFSGGVVAGHGDIETEIDAADAHMYEAKRGGKSRIVTDLIA